jgi:hypothetical protein
MSSSTSATISAYYQSIQFRDGPAGTVASFTALVGSGAMTLDQVRAAIIDDAYTTNNVDPVVRLYQAAFGRVPEAASSIEFYADRLASGAQTVSSIASSFANSPEFLARYSLTASSQPNAAFITALYLNVLGRAPDDAGFNFYLNNGMTTAQMLQGFAQSPEFQQRSEAAVESLLNANALGTAVFTGPLQITVPGKIFVLTAAIDDVSGTVGNDTFRAVDSDLDAQDTMNFGDRIDGGAGDDILSLRMADNDQAILWTTGVETIQITAWVAATLSAAWWSGVQTVEVANTGRNLATTTTVTVNDLSSNATLKLTNVGTAVSFDNALNAEFDPGAVGLNGTLQLVTSGVGGANADGNSVTSASVGITANTNVFTALNIVANGVSHIGLEAAATDDFKFQTITIVGSGTISLLMNDGNTDYVTEVQVVDLSGASGGVSFAETFGSMGDVTITGGSGNDTLRVSAVHSSHVRAGDGDDVVFIATGSATSFSLNAADFIDGGNGTDTIAISYGDAASLDDGTAEDTAALARITSFEYLRLRDNLAGDLNIQPFGVNYIQIVDNVSNGGGAGDDINFSGLTSGATIEIRHQADMADNLVVLIDGATAPGSNETLNLFMNANIIGAQIDPVDAFQYNFNIDGIESLVITTADRANANSATDRDDGYILHLSGGDADLERITVSGTAEFSFTAGVTATSLEIINAANLSGDLILRLHGINATSGISITGGSGVNTITGSIQSDIIRGGALADMLTGNTGADTMTGGAGTDTFVINFRADSEVTVDGNSVTGFDVITDYSRDVIGLDGGPAVRAGNVGGAPVAGTSVVIDVGGKASFAAADDTLAEKIIALAADNVNIDNTEVVFFEHGSDTYIYGAGLDTTLDDDDFLVKLTGVTGLTTMTIDGNGLVTLL